MSTASAFKINDLPGKVTITDQMGREWLALKVSTRHTAPDFGPTDRNIKLAIAAAVVNNLNTNGGKYNLRALTQEVL